MGKFFILKKIEKSLFTAIVILSLAYLWNEKSILYDFAANVAMVFRWIHSKFNLINDSTYAHIVYMPIFFIILFLSFGILIYKRPPKFLQTLVIIFLFFIHTIYILFRTFNTLNLETLITAIVAILMWFSELMIYFCALSIYLQLLWPVDRRKQASLFSEAVISGKYQPSVDVFIPTHSEPVNMLYRTVIGCQAMEYTHKNIYLLDDKKRPEVKKIALELGCFYISRENNIHAKAGNLNNAFDKTCSEFVVVFDADCVPTKNFLSRTVGFFQNKRIALVIAGQHFYNSEMFSHSILSLTEQSTFFRKSQQGRDAFNAILCYGTCFIVRRKAIEAIGGIPTETLAEDWATTIKLQAKGYKTYFLDELLGAGAVAESIGEFMHQRFRWTRGTLQTLFSSSNPFTIKGLNLFQKIIHLYGIFHYLIYPYYIIIYLIPLFYFYFGLAPFKSSHNQMMFFFFPFFLLNTIAFSWICNEYSSKLSSFVTESVMCLPLSTVVLKTLLNPFNKKFRVTHKEIYRKRVKFNNTIGIPLLIFFVLSLVGLIYGYANISWIISKNIFMVLAFWTIIRLYSLWVGINSSFDLPQERESVRFEHSLNCVLNISEKYITGKTVNISENGLLFICNEKLPLKTISNYSDISIPSIGIKNAKAEISRFLTDRKSLCFRFINLSLENRRYLVEFLYCKPGQWEKNMALDKKVFSAFGKSLFEIYPKQRIPT